MMPAGHGSIVAISVKSSTCFSYEIGPPRGQVWYASDQRPACVLIATRKKVKASNPSAIQTIRCARACRWKLSQTRYVQARAEVDSGERLVASSRIDAFP